MLCTTSHAFVYSAADDTVDDNWLPEPRNAADCPNAQGMMIVFAAADNADETDGRWILMPRLGLGAGKAAGAEAMKDGKTPDDAEAVDYWLEEDENGQILMCVLYDDGEIQKWITPSSELYKYKENEDGQE